MKIHHYCHEIQDTNTLETYQFNLKPFLKALTNWETSMKIASNITKLTKITNDAKRFFFFFYVQTGLELFIFCLV